MSPAARKNPFRTDRIHSIPYHLPSGHPSDLLNRFSDLNHRAALVGPHGTGKTTLLADLEASLEKCGWTIRRIRLNADKRGLSDKERALLRLPAPDSPLAVTIDGCEQLTHWQWRRTERSIRQLQAGILITTHHPGRLPTLHQHETSLELLEYIVKALVGAHHVAEFAPRLPDLFDRHNGNIRDCLRALYDRVPPAYCRCGQ